MWCLMRVVGKIVIICNVDDWQDNVATLVIFNIFWVIRASL